jgi:hypothetical protein
MAAFQQIADNKWETRNRGGKLLTLEGRKDGTWIVYVGDPNAPIGQYAHISPMAAYAQTGLSFRYFNSLTAVEDRYKAWRGIKALIEGKQVAA